VNNLILLYIILAGVIAIALAVFMYSFRSKAPKKIRPLFIIVRSITLFALFLLLINPKFKNESFRIEKPQLPVLIDNSASISHLNYTEEAKKFYEELKNHRDLNEKFDVRFFSFGEDFSPLDSLTFSEKNTNISNPLRAFHEVYKNQTAPIVLLTDGNQTIGTDYEFAASKYKWPIYSLILGDSITHVDLKIEQLNTNRYAFLKNKFPIEVFVSYNGENSISSEFSVSHGGKEVYRTTLNFSEGENSKVIEFTLPAESVGLQKYIASIRPLAEEKNKSNNQKPFAVEVIDQATNVLIVSSISHPDLGALKKSISANKQRTVDIKEPVEAIGKIEDYQLIILYQPDLNFFRLFEALEKTGKQYWLITGESTNWDALNKYQNFFTKKSTQSMEKVQGSLNKNYNSFAVEDIGFDRFPPLYSQFGNIEIHAAAQVILEQTVNGMENGNPMAATIEDNGRRYGLWDGDGFWRWRAASYRKEGNFEKFDQFVGSIVQYLASNKRRIRLEVTAESFYYNHKPIKITAQYFDKNFVFDPKATILVKIKHQEKQEEKVFPLLLKNNYYEVDLGNLNAGEYDFEVTVADEPLKTAGSFLVLDFDVEQQFLNADVAKLNRIAEKGGGQAYFIADAGTLVHDLLKNDSFKQVQKSEHKTIPLIDWKYLLGIIVFFLSVEWFIRKYIGLT